MITLPVPPRGDPLLLFEPEPPEDPTPAAAAPPPSSSFTSTCKIASGCSMVRKRGEDDGVDDLPKVRARRGEPLGEAPAGTRGLALEPDRDLTVVGGVAGGDEEGESEVSDPAARREKGTGESGGV
jgi:hypothetical protein